MATQKISVKFRLDHYKCELAPDFIETAPRIEAYLSSEIKCLPVEIKLDPNHEDDKSYDVTIEGEVSLREPIPITSKLVFSSYFVTANENGAPCLVDGGTAYVPLVRILNHSNRVFTQELGLKMHTVNNYEKGRFRFTCSAKDVDLGRAEMDTPKIGVKAVGKKADSLMAEYLESVMKKEMAMGASIEGTHNVRCPFYYGQAGMSEATRTPVPAAGYCMFKVPESNVHFWRNNLETVLAREDKTIADMRAMTGNEGLKQKARIWAEMMVLETQYLDYIGDKIDKNKRFTPDGKIGANAEEMMRMYKPSLRTGCENFGDALFCLSGDCEDLACAIMQTCASFRQADLKGHPELSELQEIGLQYVPVMSLDAVHAAAVGDDMSNKVGAHMNVNLLPAHYVKKCLQRSAPDGQSMQHLPFRQETSWSKHLPVLIAEGTGMFEPFGFNDTLQDERSYVYGGASSIRAFKKPIVHPIGAPSRFFVGSLLGFTDYWFELGANVGGLWYTYRNSSGIPDRGVKFTDLERKRDSVCLLTHPEIPQPVMERMREAVALRMPPRPLLLSEKVVEKYHPKKNKELDFLVETVHNTRSNPNARPTQDPVSFYVRDYQLNSSIMSNLQGEFVELKDIVKIEYDLESVTNEVYGYRVHVYANT